jgi:hypothetical protein
MAAERKEKDDKPSGNQTSDVAPVPPAPPPAESDLEMTRRREAERRAFEAQHVRQAMTAAEAPTGFVVADGKSLSTVRGIVGEGGKVSSLDFVRSPQHEGRGLERINELIRKGYVVPVGR